jgi:hypothetical protein
MSVRRNLVAILVAAVVVAGLSYFRACASSTLPPKLTDSERARIRETRFPVTVAVEVDQYPVYSERLASELRRTNLFNGVALLPDSPRATLVARVEQHVYEGPRGCAASLPGSPRRWSSSASDVNVAVQLKEG